jgi:S-adenosylmethionine hydrolase
MNPPRLLTLLTDFGDRDTYVGVMKGVIAHINPAINVIDLTHQIPPQDIAAARFNLMSAYPYFPLGTVHVAVVDPGVGSLRRAIALKTSQAFLVGPDNGLLSGVWSQDPILSAVELTNSQYWRIASPSSTFHGRDIFAAIGAHLASGVALEDLGHPVPLESLVNLTVAECTTTEAGILGAIQYIDHFGNLVTNIPATLIEGKPWCIQVQAFTIPAAQTYSSAAPGSLVALVGSHGWIEIALTGGSAQQQLGVAWGTPVQVVISPCR